ncbi:hypothetical protein BS50DRAFT_231976 [Corynespora cassiicola Philippines]|uniref:Uncharacterized protein n=1 Tax=Corynespora cassiicola Philippines TaxID=1448308 RepID=A0A2T2N200_CORCC|nr:hypothetical protein BS50DRAFT_231976 [Corynespora cassiicola Philippines]
MVLNHMSVPSHIALMVLCVTLNPTAFLSLIRNVRPYRLFSHALSQKANKCKSRERPIQAHIFHLVPFRTPGPLSPHSVFAHAASAANLQRDTVLYIPQTDGWSDGCSSATRNVRPSLLPHHARPVCLDYIPPKRLLPEERIAMPREACSLDDDCCSVARGSSLVCMGAVGCNKEVEEGFGCHRGTLL